MGSDPKQEASSSHLTMAEERGASVFVWVTWAILFLAVMGYVLWYGPTVPYWDEWTWVPQAVGQQSSAVMLQAVASQQSTSSARVHPSGQQPSSSPQLPWQQSASLAGVQVSGQQPSLVSLHSVMAGKVQPSVGSQTF